MDATKYYSIAKSENSFTENLELAKQNGFTHIYMWINSDLEYTYFANSYDETESEAISLYMSEKKESDREFASKYYSEYIDIYEIDEYIDIVNA